LFSMAGGFFRAHATNGAAKPSYTCYLNGEDVRVRRFVSCRPVAYTECFAVPSNSE
jgi:hypothetical protein